MPYSIAIDGPAGAGKSSIAKAVAKELGFVYIDTGAMYRAVALHCLREGIPLHNEELVSKAVEEIEISISYEGDTQQVYLNNENVSEKIRTQEVSDAASAISRYTAVRTRLVALQQGLARESSVVMDGRDIASKVLPHANLKIYLTADVRVRGERRYKELLEKGEAVDLERIISEVQERDYQDMHREQSPLVKVEDAILVDSSDLSLDETIDKILALADAR